MKRCMICSQPAEHEIEVGIRENKRPHKVLELCREHALDMVIEIRELSTRWGLSCEVNATGAFSRSRAVGRERTFYSYRKLSTGSARAALMD